MKKLFLALSLSFVSATCSLAQAQAPQVPPIEARNYILVDVTANQTLATRDADTPVEPASLTKLMSAYLVFQALREGKLSLDQSLTVSERAWRTGMTDASRMFIQVGTQVKVEDLIKGMIVISGNDATVQLAEAVGGSLEGFVDMMNRQAQAWGLKNTAFKNADGLPAPGHISTARELSVIATQLIRTFPEYMKYYSMKDFAYNIKRPQQNRNLLLWRDPSVDGLKTGYTDAAGYCLIATANRQLPNGARRLLSVVLGASSKEARAVESQKLLNWGYTAFDAVKLFDAHQVVTQAQVWKGAEATAKLGSAVPVMIVVPRGGAAGLKTEVVRNDPLIAPLAKGQRVGTLKVTSGTQVVAQVPMTALEAVPQAGFFGRLWDSLRLWIR
jgi:D-alanyl-D-alanine carboxypeptidase (penicillin-binding protein 5/6)